MEGFGIDENSEGVFIQDNDTASNASYSQDNDTASNASMSDRNQELAEELRGLIKRKREMIQEINKRPEVVLKELECENEYLDQVLNMHDAKRDTDRVLVEDGAGNEGAAAAEPLEENLLTRDIVSKMMEGLDRYKEPGDRGSDERSAGMSEVLNNLLNHEAMDDLQNKVREYQLKEQQKGVNPHTAMGTSIRDTYECGAKKIEEKYPQDEAMAATMKGITYMITTGVGINQAVKHGYIKHEHVESLVEGAMSVFKKITGFTWKLFERTMQDPAFWGGIIFSIFGALITGIGALISGSRIAHHAAKLSC